MAGIDDLPNLDTLNIGPLEPLTVDEYWKSSFSEQFGDGKLIWLSNKSNKEIRIKFLKAAFPKHKLISAIEDLRDVTDTNTVHIFSVELDEESVDIYSQLQWVSKIAIKRNLKIVFTAALPIRDALGSSRTVEEFKQIILRVSNYMLDDRHLLTGKFMIPLFGEDKPEWKHLFLKWFAYLKPIWIESEASNDDIFDFINRQFPGEVLRGTTETLAEAPKDKIIFIVGHIDENTYENDFFTIMVRVADLVKDKKLRVILTSEDFIGSVAPHDMTVAELRKLETRIHECAIHNDIVVKAHHDAE